MLHGDVPVRLSTGEEVEVKYLKAGDRLNTADGASVTLTAIVKESRETAVFATAPGFALKAYPNTEVYKGGAWVKLAKLGSVLPKERCDAVYSLHADWAPFLRIPAIKCGGLFVKLTKDYC